MAIDSGLPLRHVTVGEGVSASSRANYNSKQLDCQNVRHAQYLICSQIFYHFYKLFPSTKGITMIGHTANMVGHCPVTGSYNLKPYRKHSRESNVIVTRPKTARYDVYTLIKIGFDRLGLLPPLHQGLQEILHSEASEKLEQSLRHSS